MNVSQKCLALAGMNPDFLTDGSADFRFVAFNEAHANSAEFIGWPDCGGNFQRGLSMSSVFGESRWQGMTIHSLHGRLDSAQERAKAGRSKSSIQSVFARVRRVTTMLTAHFVMNSLQLHRLE